MVFLPLDKKREQQDNASGPLPYESQPSPPIMPAQPTQTLFSENRKENAPPIGTPKIQAESTGAQPGIGPQGIEISTGGKVDTLRAQSTPQTAESVQMQVEQQRAQQRQQEIATAFDYALNNPLPSSFAPQDIQGAGVARAAGNAALNTGLTGGGGLVAGAIAGSVVPGVGTAIGAGVGLAAGVITSAIKGGLNEVQNQRADSIELAVKKYDRAEQLRVELIRAANQGADPYELIDAYRQMEQEKITAREGLEYAARRDPSGFSDKARGQLNAMKQEETPQVRYIRNQRFLKALQNPKGLAPDVAEQPALIDIAAQ